VVSSTVVSTSLRAEAPLLRSGQALKAEGSTQAIYYRSAVNSTYKQEGGESKVSMPGLTGRDKDVVEKMVRGEKIDLG
jgi:hypothetical protein